MEKLKKQVINIFDRAVDTVILITIFLFLTVSVYTLWDIWMLYHSESNLQNQLLAYRLSPEDDKHPGLEELMKSNSDVCAWLYVENTNIDYPVVRGPDNLKYVNTDCYGNYSMHGAIFLDYRSSRDFSDSYSVVYGHHMEKHAMFGDLDLFEDEEFFDQNKTGYIMIPDKTYELEVFAYMKVSASDRYIYQPIENEMEPKQALLDYIKKYAEHHDDISISVNDSVVALTTCASDITDGRHVVLARVNER